MAVSYVGAAQSSGNVTTHSVTVPAGVSAGDLILVAFATAGTVTATPAGYTLIDSGAGGNVTLWLYGRVADGSESGTTVSFTISAAGRSNLGLLVLSGVGASPIGAYAIAGHAGAASTAHTMPSITSTATGSVAVAFAAERGTLTAGQTWAGPAGYAERVDSNYGGSGAIGLYAGTRLTATTAGDAMGGGTATGSVSTTNAVMATIEILPAAATVPATITATAGSATAGGGDADLRVVKNLFPADNYDRAGLQVRYDNRPFTVGRTALGTAMLNAQPDPDGPAGWVDITDDVKRIDVTNGVDVVDGVLFAAAARTCRVTFEDLRYAELLVGATILVTYYDGPSGHAHLFSGQVRASDVSLTPSYVAQAKLDRSVTVTATDVVETKTRTTMPAGYTAPRELARERLRRLLGPGLEFEADAPPLPSMMAPITAGSGTMLDAINDALAAGQCALVVVEEIPTLISAAASVSWVLSEAHCRDLRATVGTDTGVTGATVSLPADGASAATVRLPGARWRNEVELSVGLDRYTLDMPAPTADRDVEPARYAATLPLAQGGTLQVDSLTLGSSAITDGLHLIRPLDSVDALIDDQQFGAVVLGITHSIDTREWRVSLELGPSFLLDRIDPTPAPPVLLTSTDGTDVVWAAPISEHLSQGGYGTRVQVAAGAGGTPPFEDPYLIFDGAMDPAGADFTDGSTNLSGFSPGTTVTLAARVLTDDPLIGSGLIVRDVVAGTGPVDPDPVTATRFGWHTGSGDGGLTPWSAAYGGAVTAIGAPRCYRAFRPDGTLPTSFGASSWGGTPNDASSVLYLCSWKPVYATLLAGGYDSVINAFLTWAHANGYHVRLATWHEYDVKGMDPAQFKAMWTYVAQKVRTFNSPYVKNALINGGYKAASVQATYLPNDLSLIDVFASDPYTVGQAVADKNNYQGGRKCINQYHADFKLNYLPETVRSGIAELGWAINTGTSDAAGADWYRGALDRCRELEAEFVAVYCHDATNQYALQGNRLVLYGQTAAAVKSYVDASPIGF